MADETRKALCWWQEGIEPQERATQAVAAQQVISDLPSECYRRDRDLQNIRLYENNPVITLYNFAGKFYQEASTMVLPQIEQSTNNRAKSAIDTLSSQIASTNQRARFIVVDGNYRQRHRARELQNFADGLAYELKLHQLRQRAFLDACILESGVGCITFYRRNGRCAAERSLATEFSIDPLDGMVNGEWQTLYRRRPLPRDVIAAAWGGKNQKTDDAIENANPISAAGAPADHVEVFEAWHLPTDESSKDGWHVVALDIADGMLAIEPYTKQFHETVFLSLEPRFTTGWGLSIMTQVRKLQYRINANEYRWERALKLCHSGHLYINAGNKLKKSQVTNEIGTVWEGTSDTPPQQILFQQVGDNWAAAIERDGQRIFENTGINLAASQGETNSGLNASAAAKREDTAKSDKRNAVRQQRWEQNHLDCMRVALSVVADCVAKTENGKDRKKATGSYVVKMPGERGRGLSKADWKDAALDEEQYVMQIKPASPIPTEPAGLVAFGEHMLEIGEWQPGQLTDYLQDLDADGRVSRKQSQRRNFEKMFEALLYEKTAAAAPDEFTNYGMAIDIGTEYLEQGLEDDVPEKHLERVRRYLRQCKKLAKAAQEAAAAQAAANAPPAAAGAGPKLAAA